MFDYVIVTHLPVFYKVNLYNEIAKKSNLYVVFIANNTTEKRSNDFVTLENLNFEYVILNEGEFQSRNRIQSILKLKKTLKSIKYKKILVSGWDLPEFWSIVLTSVKRKNILALESTVMESNTQGIKGYIKKFFLSRITTVFASGCLHKELLKRLNYTGDIKITKGVGIINKQAFEKKTTDYSRSFLFIGRLAPEKNLTTLIDVFNNLPEYKLTIIGQGSQKDELQTMAKENIIFIEQVENKFLKDIFLKNDILVLPSLSEPWGLVVEEALYFGLPVIISKNCGACELIENEINGLIIDPYNKLSITEAVLKIDAKFYTEMIKGLDDSCINKKDLVQISIYR